MSKPDFVTAATIVLVSGLLAAQTPGGVTGDPLPGVTPIEFEEFRLGLDDFLEVSSRFRVTRVNRSSQPRPPSSPVACPFRSLAQDSSKRFQTNHCWRSKIPSIETATA